MMASESSENGRSLRELQDERVELRQRLARLEAGVLDATCGEIAARLDALEQKLDVLGQLPGMLGEIQTRLDSGFQAAVPQPEHEHWPDAPTMVDRGDERPTVLDRAEDSFTSLTAIKTLDASADAGPPWPVIVFGEELAADEGLTLDREALLSSLHSGEPTAVGLVGQLLVFHAAPDLLKPQLLKDIGEAYYRWRPKTTVRDDPLEVALAAWLERACDTAGTRRKIDLVRPGMRFNVAYHKATDKGVEITQVSGWVILREDGSVYQKASVGVR